jgi:V/A-type H+-transporting ATPase subunit E
MDGELQQLIDRIKKDAVEAGRQESEALLVQAREEAAHLVRAAEARARALHEQAEREAHLFTERGQQTLQQAARDLLITVGRGVEDILSSLAAEAAEQALTPDTVAQMLVKLAGAFAANGGREARIEVLLSAEDQAALVTHFRQLYQKELAAGLTLRVDPSIVKGFKVRAEGQQVLHDYTSEAIAEALSRFLRPHLAEIVTRVARGDAAAAGPRL